MQNTSITKNISEMFSSSDDNDGLRAAYTHTIHGCVTKMSITVFASSLLQHLYTM